MSATLYMIPCPISENDYSVLPQYVMESIYALDHFIVERAKTARKFLKEINHPIPLQEIFIEEMDKHDKNFAKTICKEWIDKGLTFGIISEAGCPGVADPGASLVAIAHEKKAKVVPLIGPSSILLALMASGMNGQNFTFHGYLPNQQEALIKKLSQIEKNISHNRSAEIFIETPYRNKAMWNTLTKLVSGNIKLCIASDITGQSEYIKTMRLSEWKKESFPLADKIPAIYILGT